VLLLKECEEFKEAEEIQDLMTKVYEWKEKCDKLLNIDGLSDSKGEAKHLS
jgi:hypothetical protein